MNLKRSLLLLTCFSTFISGCVSYTDSFSDHTSTEEMQKESSDSSNTPSEEIPAVSSGESQTEASEIPIYTISANIAADTGMITAASLPEDPDNIIDLSTTLYTYDKMESDLKLLSSCYPQYIRLENAGTTADGRSLYVVYFGSRNASRQIFICAATHAREYMTTQLVMKQLEYYCSHYESGSYNSIPYNSIFENTCFVVVPMVNPDGVSISQFGETGLNRQDLRDNLHAIYASDQIGGFTDESYETYLTRWKANGLGVDLNRNYSPGWEMVTDRSAPSSGLFKGETPGSEAETQVLMELIESLDNPLMAISYHSYGDLVYWQYGQPEPLWTQNQNLAAHISNLTGYYLAGYSNEAGFSNWCVNVKGIPSVTVETGSVPTPLPLDQFDRLWSLHREMWAMLGSVY